MALGKGSSKKERLENAAFEKEQENIFSDAGYAAFVNKQKNTFYAGIVDKVIANPDGGRDVIKGEVFLKKSAEKIYSFGQTDKTTNTVREALVKAATNASTDKVKELGLDRYI